MAKADDKTLKMDFQLKAIELLRSSINLPTSPDVSINDVAFNVNIESKADAANKLLFVILSVDIRSNDQHHLLGSLTASCIYSITNFEEVIIMEPNGAFHIPKLFVDTFNSISISTTRGIMFSTFKGTFLHNAILPVVEPGAFIVNMGSQ